MNSYNPAHPNSETCRCNSSQAPRYSALEHTFPLLSVLSASFALSFLPYLFWFTRFHRWIFIADPDNLLYLQLAAQPYHSAVWYLADPVRPDLQTYYSWLQFVPAAKLARAFGMGIFAVNDLWHLWAAVGVALGLYILFLHFSRDRWLAAACAVLAMSDAGMLFGQPLVRQLTVMTRLLAGHPGSMLHEWPPVFLNQWRVVDPALGLPLMFGQIVLLAKARTNERPGFVIASAITFAGLFYVYFYFWTAAGMGLCLAWLFDRGGRRVYGWCLAIGLVIAIPSLIQEFYLKSHIASDTLSRVSFLLRVPRLQYFLLPKVAIIYLFLAALWIQHRTRVDAIYLLGLGTAAILLSNNHVITGLDLNAGHWRMVWGPAVEILVLAGIVDPSIMAGSQRTRALLRRSTVAASLVFFACALYLIGLDTEKNTISRQISEKFSQFAADTASRLPSLAAGSVIAGDNTFCDFMVVMRAQRPLSGYAAEISPWIGATEWQERIAANQYLRGTDREGFRVFAQKFSADVQWGPWAVNPARRPELFSGLMSQYDVVARAPEAMIARFRIRYVVLRRDERLPGPLSSYFTPLWRGEVWRVWERTSERAGKVPVSDLVIVK